MLARHRGEQVGLLRLLGRRLPAAACGYTGGGEEEYRDASSSATIAALACHVNLRSPERPPLATRHVMPAPFTSRHFGLDPLQDSPASIQGLTESRHRASIKPRTRTPPAREPLEIEGPPP